MESVRAFIAIALPPEICLALSDCISRIKQHHGDIKWVRTEGLHITLKFLGDIQPGRVEEIASSLSQIGSACPAFEISIEGAGAFPGMQRPRIIWTGIRQGAEELIRLASQIDGAMETFGFEPEGRPFKPHITLGRVRSPKNIRETMEAVKNQTGIFGTFRANAIILMQSVLKPTGAEYTPLHQFQIQG